MSEEEILNEFISIINAIYLQGYIKDNNGEISTTLKNILDLYNKEKEKNKALNATLTLVNIGLDEYISKDKIREVFNKYRFCKVEKLKEFYQGIQELLEG